MDVSILCRASTYRADDVQYNPLADVGESSITNIRSSGSIALT